jgi:hypothetical protein
MQIDDEDASTSQDPDGVYLGKLRGIGNLFPRCLVSAVLELF